MANHPDNPGGICTLAGAELDKVYRQIDLIEGQIGVLPHAAATRRAKLTLDRLRAILNRANDATRGKT